MCSSILAYMSGQLCWFTLCMYCLVLVKAAEMTDSRKPQTCQDLACENNNVCKAERTNGTESGHVYCLCKGQWAGTRCEKTIHTSTKVIMSERVTLEIRSIPSTTYQSVQDLQDIYVAQLTIGVWNMNNSAQCLLLRRNAISRSVTLDGLERSQYYIICVANGFADSCSVFGNSVGHISTWPNCVKFQTKIVDEVPFDFDLIIVLSAASLFFVLFAVFLYINRHSVVVQLILTRYCLGKCNVCKEKDRRPQPMRKQREMSEEISMFPYMHTDFEVTGNIPPDTVTEDLFPEPQSCHTLLRESQKHIYIPESGETVSTLALKEHDDLLYYDHSLTTVSSQNYDLLTSTYHPVPYSDPIYSGKCSDWNSVPSFPLPSTQRAEYEANLNIKNECEAGTKFISQESLPHSCDQMHDCSCRSYCGGHYGGMKDVKFRNFNYASKSRQRPYSLPYTLMSTESHESQWKKDSGLNSQTKRPFHVSLSDDASLQVLAATELNPIRLCRDQHHVGKNNVSHIKGCDFTHGSFEDFNNYISNTLPRSKKPKGLPPNGVSYNCRSDILIRTQPPQRPTRLELTTSVLTMPSENSVQSASLATGTQVAPELRQPSRHIKNLISHFENNWPFFKSSKRATDEEEFRDLQSPLAEERERMSRRSRHVGYSKPLLRNTPTPSSDSSKHSRLTSNPIFGGHPSDHVIPPFSTDDENDNDHNHDDDGDINEKNENDTETSHLSFLCQSAYSEISCYDDDDSNLVTPFCTDLSSDDDTCNDVVSLVSTDTIRDEDMYVNDNQ